MTCPIGRKDVCCLKKISQDKTLKCVYLFFRWIEEYLLPIYTQEWSRGQRAKEVLVFT